MATIEQLEARIDSFEKTLLQMARNNVAVTEKADSTTEIKVQLDEITPYTETKTAYYGESEKTFYGVPDGNIEVFFDNYNGQYTVNKIVDRVTVKFDVLSQPTNITISVR